MKKMSFWMSLFMAFGSIIGAGIFARTPLVIRLVGNGLVWGFLLAAVFVFLKTVPEVVLSSALPANGASYMHLTRLLHPSLGAVYAFNFHTADGHRNCTSVHHHIHFWNQSEWVQNVCVVILFGALAIYIFAGLPNVNIQFMDVIKPAISVTRLWAAMVLLHGSFIPCERV